MDKKAFSPIEEIIVLVMLAVFIGVLYHRYSAIELKAKTEVTKVDLYNLKLAVELFKVKNGNYPDNLTQLYKSGLLENTLQKSKFANNKIIDPFGNAYVYDNKTGKVFLNKKTRELLNAKQ